MDRNKDCNPTNLNATFEKAEESCMALKDVLHSLKGYTIQTVAKIADLENSSREMKDKYDKLESRLEKECTARIRERTIFVDIIRELKTRMNRVLEQHEEMKNSLNIGKLENLKTLDVGTQSIVSFPGTKRLIRKKKRLSTSECETSVYQSKKFPKINTIEMETPNNVDVVVKEDPHSPITVVVRDHTHSPVTVSSCIEEITDIPDVAVKDEPMTPPPESIKVSYSSDIDIKDEPFISDLIDIVTKEEQQLAPVKVNKSEPVTPAVAEQEEKELSVTDESFHSNENSGCDATFLTSTKKNNFRKEMSQEKESKQYYSPLQENICNEKTLTDNKQKKQPLSPGYKYMCQVCGVLSDSRSAHNVHLMSHNNLIQYECHLCMKIYCVIQDYKIHMLSHSERKYDCDQCSKYYSFRSDLMLHKMVAHEVTEQEENRQGMMTQKT